MLFLRNRFISIIDFIILCMELFNEIVSEININCYLKERFSSCLKPSLQHKAFKTRSLDNQSINQSFWPKTEEI